MYNYVICATEYDWYTYMYQEILIKDNVRYFKGIIDIEKLLVPGEHIFRRVGRWLYRLDKKAYYSKALRKISFNNDFPIIFIHFARFLQPIKEGLIDAEIDVFPDSKQVFFFTDAKRVTKENLSLLRKCMDAIGVYDPYIAEKYNLEFWPNSFPTLKPEKNELKYDLCFVGNGLGRTKKIERIARLCKKNDIRTAIYLCNPDSSERVEGIHYIDTLIPYAETVELVKHSRCVLELEREYHACSMRVLEAVVLNKKILTDNMNVFKMPCCGENRQYICCFNDMSEIDIDFLKNDDVVDFQYNGEYEAEKFLKEIEKKIEDI